ncbi:sugar transferase, partial [Candidatus Sumerlaeota bacterium]
MSTDSASSGKSMGDQPSGLATAIEVINPSPSVADRPQGLLQAGLRHATRACVEVRALRLLLYLCWMVYDGAMAYAALLLGYAMSPKAEDHIASAASLGAIIVGTLLAGHIAGLYQRRFLSNLPRIPISAAFAALLAVSGLALFNTVSLQLETIGRWALLICFLWLWSFLSAPRIVGHLLTRLYKIRVLLVGDAQAAERFGKRLAREGGHFSLVGFCGREQSTDPGFLATVDHLPEACQQGQIDQVVITRTHVGVPGALDRCFEAAQGGCAILDECSFYEEAFEQVPVDHIDENWFFSSKIAISGQFQSSVKRTTDILVASSALLLTCWLFPLLWCLVRLTSKGGAFYGQVRCGQFGRTFRIHKFRTMTVDAEQAGAQWAAKSDPRVTKLGYVLRKTRLDEIPQFWNVLKGDMSFVGPRPERPELTAEIEKEVSYFAFRGWARPGITGLAQVRYPYGANIEDAK